MPTWRVLGPWQQVEKGLALPGTGLAEAGLGFWEKSIGLGGRARVAKELPTGVARLIHRTLPGGS